MRNRTDMSTEIAEQDLRWPTYPARGVTLDAAVFESDRRGGAL